MYHTLFLLWYNKKDSKKIKPNVPLKCLYSEGRWHNVTLKELYWFNEQNFPLSKEIAMELFQGILDKMQKGIDKNDDEAEADCNSSGNS